MRELIQRGSIMRIHPAALFPAFIFSLLTVACNKGPAIETESTQTASPVVAAESGIIRFGAFNHFNSGLPNHYPSFAVIADGHVQAVRAGLEEVTNALDTIAKGEQLLDEDAARQDMQAAMEKLLASQQMTPETLTATHKKVILLFSPDERLGECPPCTAAFGTLQPGSLIGDFTIIKAMLENR